jgi:hypothetical protein
MQKKRMELAQEKPPISNKIEKFNSCNKDRKDFK